MRCRRGSTSVSWSIVLTLPIKSLLFGGELSCLPVDKTIISATGLAARLFYMGLTGMKRMAGGGRLHGFRHPAFALYNASKDFSLNRKERSIIARHMFPLTVLPPRCLEAWIVCFVDKYCAFSETMGDGRIQWER